MRTPDETLAAERTTPDTLHRAVVTERLEVTKITGSAEEMTEGLTLVIETGPREPPALSTAGDSTSEMGGNLAKPFSASTSDREILDTGTFLTLSWQMTLVSLTITA